MKLPTIREIAMPSVRAHTHAWLYKRVSEKLNEVGREFVYEPICASTRERIENRIGAALVHLAQELNLAPFEQVATQDSSGKVIAIMHDGILIATASIDG